MHKFVTYRLLVKFTALMLMIGVALPTGIQAKELIDFCLNPVEETGEMLPDHSCCTSESEEEGTKPDSDDATQHDCDWSFICACHIDRSPLSGQNWTTPNTIFTGTLAAAVTIEPETHADNFNPYESPDDTYSTPPIFLLNSTFLN